MARIKTERDKEYNKEYNRTHKKEQHEWYVAHKEERKAAAKAYYCTNREQISKRQAEYTARRIQTNRELLSKLRPLSCDRCGYDKCIAALEFHHTDPAQKENFRDSLGYWVRTLTQDKFMAKVLNTKYELLCANCHRELHHLEGLTTQGGPAGTGMRNGVLDAQAWNQLRDMKSPTYVPKASREQSRPGP